MFNIKLENDIKNGNVTVCQDGDNIKMTVGLEKYFFRDDIRYITKFCKSLDTLDFDSILIGGLGVGVVPYYLENYKSKTNIDVVESNPYVVETVSSLINLKYTTITTSLFFTYKTDKKYDLILLDLWWDDFLKEWGKSQDFFMSKIKIKFKNNLNEGGKIYVPILDLII